MSFQSKPVRLWFIFRTQIEDIFDQICHSTTTQNVHNVHNDEIIKLIYMNLVQVFFLDMIALYDKLI